MIWLRAPNSQAVPGISVGLFRMLFGLIWLDLAWQKAPWVIQDGRRFGWFLLIAPHLVFAHTRAGRVLGLDQLLWGWLGPEREQCGVSEAVLRLA